MTPEERALWEKVTRQATPMRPTHKDAPDIQEMFKPPSVPPKSIEPFTVGSRATSTALPRAAPDDVPKLNMDKKAFGQLKRGKMTPEARVDLHGMTLAQAGPVLSRFIRESHAAGRRLVLVITGKGKHRDEGGPIPVPRGVLRRQVPEWLRQAPLSSMVLQVTDSHLKHGGEGAYYVYLRRRK